MVLQTFICRTISVLPFAMSDICTSLKKDPSGKLSLTTDQQNSTALKWGDDGELSDLDLQRILKLLSQADPVAEALISASQDPIS